MRTTMKKLHLCLFLLVCVLVASQKTALDTPENLRNIEGEQRSLITKRGRILQDEVPSNVPFPCNVTGGRSSEVPESVNRLRPGDIDVIAAMGDSLTAGNGIFATNLFQLGIENRGVSASIGGEKTWRTYLTLPNILKEYNPNLIGYALGDSLLPHQASQLNVAEAGAMSRDMPFMAQYLINKIKRNPKIDIKKHWKLISVMIGSNDFCVDICHISSPWSVLEAHKTDLVNTLRKLRDNLPRTIVALLLAPNLKTFVDSRKRNNSLQCYITTTLECHCLLALQFQDRQSEYYEIMRRWQELEEEIADYSEFHKNDFTVVALPNLKNVIIPLADDGLADLSYLSSDCFHVTQKSNALYANGIWNNLLEPYGNKSESWSPLYEKFLCPTSARPFLVTRENSRKNNKL